MSKCPISSSWNELSFCRPRDELHYLGEIWLQSTNNDDDTVCYHNGECIGDMVCSVSEHVG